MTKVEKKKRLEKIVARMKEIYPEALCALEYGNDPWRLMVMGRLSAQCTDARVNVVCRELFSRYPTAEALAGGDISDIERIVKPCGLYHTKAASIKEASRILTEEMGGVLPDTMDGLLTLPGVGRKVASLILGDVYRQHVVVCDTHFMRIMGRLGMYREGFRDPDKIEKIMLELMPKGEGSDFCHRIVFFGREYCPARGNDCASCPMSDLCLHAEKAT
ncbi:MAG: endonuclease III [Clostridia bacterium]|nr:endonuclease III [Clostridia bacterium]